MPGKRLSALVALALMGASTAGAAQSVAAPARAPEPAMETLSSEDGSALSSAETIGALFGLIVLVILIWKLGDKEDLVAPPPTSP